MRLPPDWQPTETIEAILFDCDGTLSEIEGIDEIAEENGVGRVVSEITEKAMSESGVNPEIYKKRLLLAKPSAAQVTVLGEKYYMHRAPESERVIHILKRLDKSIYIISAGMRPAVELFAERLAIPKVNVFAVEIYYDKNNIYHDFNSQNPLIKKDGKREIVSVLQSNYTTMAYIGDGMNDLAAKDKVTRFIGYGGVKYRPQIAKVADFYIYSRSFLPLLPLLLTEAEVLKLNLDEKRLHEAGLGLLKSYYL